MKRKIFFALLLSGLLFIGCSSKKVEEEKNVITMNLGTEQNIDPMKMESLMVVNNAFEGLLTEDETGKIVLGSAESYDVSKDGLVYTFKIKENAKWSDGKKLTADDFYFAWMRAIDPKEAFPYAFQFFYVKNAEDYLLGKAKAEDVGIKVLDEATIQITLNSPVTYFINLVAFPVFYPVRKDVVENNPDWATKPETYLTNGPFKLVEWTPKDQLVFEKNTNYWDAANVKLDKLIFKFIPDDGTALNSFRNGEVDIISSIPSTEIPTLLADGSAKKYPVLMTNYFLVNTIGKNISNPEVAKFLGNKKVRQALSLALDREALVTNVTKGGQLPAASFVAKGALNSAGKDFSTKEYFPVTGNVEEAKKLLAEAGYSDTSKIPTIVYSFAEEGSDKKVAEAVQDMWKTKLGVNLELKVQERAVFWGDRKNFMYELGARWWSADYNDPMTFLDMFVSNTTVSPTGFASKKYDELITKSKVEQNPETRTKMLREAEDILMDEMPIIPIYFNSTVVMSNPKISGWYVTPLGAFYYKKATKNK